MKKPFLGILFLLFFHSLTLSVRSQTSPDAAAMEALKKSLEIPKTLDWSDPNPCEWQKIQCLGNRVTRIQIGDLGMQGTLPPDIKSLSSLQVFEVMRNNLTGPVPSFAGLSSLQGVLLNQNQFNYFPPDFFVGLTSLESISVDRNPFAAWVIPESLKNATSLRSFSARGANLSGTIPEFFGGDTFPALTTLMLSTSTLQGGIPSSFARSSIQKLVLNGLNLTGPISVLQNMTSLTEITLNLNHFTGPIPDLSALTNLQIFNLRDNQLTGIVPLSLVNLPALKTVNLTNNDLQGSTPKFDTKKVDLDMRPGSNSFCLDEPGVPCDNQVNILLSIVEPLGYPLVLAESWKGNNPCSSSESWKGITCDGGNVSGVTFPKMGLSGTISPDFSKLTSLRQIDLADNELTGTIPSELTSLPNLSRLDVSNNHLYGEVPKFRQNVLVVTAGNSDIGKDHSSFTPSGTHPSSAPRGGGSRGGGEGKNSNTKSVVGSVVGAVCGAVVVVGLGVCLYTRKQKRSSRVQSPHAVVIHPHHSEDGSAVKITVAGSSVNGNGSETYSHASSGPSDIHMVEAGSMVISIQVLRNVTNNFSEQNILGRGGFGTVYKGELHDGTKIAVKRMESGVVGEKGLAEFKSEIAVLTKVRHRHLVGLLGYCLDGNERILVYEYMPQGTLSRHLFQWKEENLKPLEWTRRLTIALDVARGVEYLHGLAHQSFIHRDLKPSNILLGDDMRAKVADFGLVRLAPENGKHSIETRLAGTFGYLAPEYAGN